MPTANRFIITLIGVNVLRNRTIGDLSEKKTSKLNVPKLRVRACACYVRVNYQNCAKNKTPTIGQTSVIEEKRNAYTLQSDLDSVPKRFLRRIIRLNTHYIRFILLAKDRYCPSLLWTEYNESGIDYARKHRNRSVIIGIISSRVVQTDSVLFPIQVLGTIHI